MATHVLILAVLVTVSTVSAFKFARPACFVDSDCNPGQCCGIRKGPMIVSKRIAPIDPSFRLHGTCKPYLSENQYCFGYWKQNGDCGCPPSMTCKYFPPKEVVDKVGKRRPAPGQYLCKPI